MCCHLSDSCSSWVIAIIVVRVCRVVNWSLTRGHLYSVDSSSVKKTGEKQVVIKQDGRLPGVVL